MKYWNKKTRGHFLTGAAYCFSRALTRFIDFWVGNNNMVRTCSAFGFADDVALGAVVTMVLNVPITESYLFHSVFDKIPPDSHKKDEEEVKNQITFMNGGRYMLFRNYTPAFNTNIDPTRFLSLHCFLYPNDVICSKGN